MRIKLSFLLLLVCAILATNSIKAQNIYTYAGDGTPGFSGDGFAATTAEIYDPYDVTIDGMGRLYISDEGNNRIRRVSPAGIISTFAGNGMGGYAGDGSPATATGTKIFNPFGIVAVGANSLYIADAGNNRIRFVNGAGIISTIAGNGTSGYLADGVPAASTRINEPAGVVRDIAGNMYISDYLNNRVRKVNAAGIITTFAGTGVSGYSGDGAQATNAKISFPWGVTTDINGNIYFADQGNNCVRKVDTFGIITTIAGIGMSPGFSGDGSAATTAQLLHPWGVAADGAGNIYIADYGNNCLRKVNSSGIISTAAGIGGSPGFSGDTGPATAAQLNGPTGVALDGNGTIAISDRLNQRIRIIKNPVTPVMGPNNLCVGDTATFSDATSGGTWSSSNTAVATVDATGIVTPVAPGIVSIIYTTSEGNAWRVANVRPLPVLTSTLTPPGICTTAPFDYTPASMPGGVTFAWARAAVTGVSNAAGTGMGNPGETLVVTASTPVVVTYVYTLTDPGPGGCINTQNVNVTVDPAPSAGTITGPYIICDSLTMTLADDVSGGTWSSSNGNATVNSSGLVTGVNPGPGAIIYTFANVCGTATTTYAITIQSGSDCLAYVPASSVIPTSLKVYPNPNNGDFIVNLTSDVTKEANVIITNVVGEKVKEFSATANSPVDVKLDVPEGVYFIRANTVNGILTDKVMVGR